MICDLNCSYHHQLFVSQVASALKLNDLMALYVDLLTLQKALTGELYDAVMRQMHQSQDAALQSSEVVAAIRCLCDHCSKVVDTQLATVQQRITGVCFSPATSFCTPFWNGPMDSKSS